MTQPTTLTALDPGKLNPREPTKCECKWANWHLTQSTNAKATLADAQKSAEWWRETANRATQNARKSTAKSPIPPLKPHRIPQYIAAVARAVACGNLTAAQGNGLLYAAQVLISLMRREQPPPPTPTVVGFTPPKKSAPKKESQK